jgi:hypothetical protein
MKAMSDIRVFVTFPESAVVFAGENLECKITFKNISSPPGSGRLLHSSPRSANGGFVSPVNGGGGGGGGGALGPVTSPLQPPATAGGRSNVTSPRIPSGRPISSHKPPLSLSVSAANPPASPAKPPASPAPVTAGTGGKGHKHRRSISIVSLGPEVGVEGGGRGQVEDGLWSPPLVPGRQGRGSHARSSSMQTAPRRSPGMPSGTTPTSGTRSNPPPSIFFSDPSADSVVMHSYNASIPVP